MADKPTSNVPILDLSMLKKQSVQIDFGDNKEHFLEINTTDMNVVTRLSDGYHKLIELDQEVSDLGKVSEAIEETDTDDVVKAKLSNFADKLKSVDTKMREIIDYIFDTNVSEVCCPYGSMYDPVAGGFRYEFIMDALMTLYNDSLASEMAKTKSRIKSHTAKYTKKKSR